MCGIVGFAGWKAGHEERRTVLGRMCDSIRHRGPDQEGQYVDERIALGIRRLRVIDLLHSDQPIANEDRTIHTVFNGEIYNFRLLRQELERGGHQLATEGDTETIVHLYEDDGGGFVERVRGMFALAVWDARRGRLLLVRDRVGIKPLYYWEHDGMLAFGSELRALVHFAPFRPRIDHKAIGAFLAFGYVPEPMAIFEGVRKLPPGHLLEWEQGRAARLKRYWTPVVPELQIAEEEAKEELRRLLEEAVACHLESDVPLGAFLSGGLDSSTVVALMARHSASKVKTFSIGFDDPAFNEAPHAAQVAHELETEHHELIVKPESGEELAGLVDVFDEPFGDSSALPMLLVSKLARKHVTVALSGDGGDELFGGYTRYREALAMTQLPSSVRSFARPFVQGIPHAFPGRNRLVDLTRDARGRYAATVVAPVLTAEGGIASKRVAEQVGPLNNVLDEWFEQCNGRDFATQMTLVDVMTYLPGDILTKVDRTTMAVSLEARVPLLDHHLVTFALGLPSGLKMSRSGGKRIFRDVIKEIVPSSVLEKPKQGFAVPLKRWFRSELRHHTVNLACSNSSIAEFVDPQAVRRIVREHQIGRRDHSGMIWRLVVLDLWLRAPGTP